MLCRLHFIDKFIDNNLDRRIIVILYKQSICASSAISLHSTDVTEIQLHQRLNRKVASCVEYCSSYAQAHTPHIDVTG